MGGGDAFVEDGGQYVGFFQQGGQLGIGCDHAHAEYDLEPNAGFTQLFERHFQLVDEIRLGLGALGFRVVGGGRGAAAEDLIGDVASGLGCRQAFRQLNDEHGKVDEPLAKIECLWPGH